MIIPLFWSESKEMKIVGGRQFTVKRFGWSDISEQEAKTHATARLNEAITTLEKEGDVRRIDHKTSYNGAEGIPIREEVISKLQDVVISRNSYGALCLNTPDVLFADIDFETRPTIKAYVICFLSLTVIALIISLYIGLWAVFFVSLFFALTCNPTITKFIHTVTLKNRGGIEKITIDQINNTSRDNPELHIRLYRTPLGFRVLLMNNTYDPNCRDAINILERLNSDKTYIQMCRNQNCFRARVSPKPWRIGVDRLKPRPGVWPINPQRLPERAQWVENYNQKAKRYSSCQFISHIGSNSVNPRAEIVRELHDDMCKALIKEPKIA